MASEIRLYVDARLQQEAPIGLTPGQVHYLATVMRRKDGDGVLLFNGQDGEWRATLRALSRKKGMAICAEQTRQQTQSPDLWLVFAPVKKPALDQVAQKATELGVAGLQPVFTERTILPRIKMEKLHLNVIEAAEQSERVEVPKVRDGEKLSSLLGRWHEIFPDRRLVFCDEETAEGGRAPSLVEALTPFQQAPGKWAILIGPEGGFTEAERAQLQAQDFVIPVNLGPRILRADTAAWAALSLWQAILGDWK